MCECPTRISRREMVHDPAKDPAAGDKGDYFMYRKSMYEIHNETMEVFVDLFNSCDECSNLVICPNPEETYGNDGWIIDNESGKKIGYDWERRDDHFKNGVFKYDTLGQYERKLIKDNIQISLQCDEDNTAVAVGWHKDWLEETKVKKELKTDSDKKQTGYARYTKKFNIYSYSDGISALKREIQEKMNKEIEGKETRERREQLRTELKEKILSELGNDVSQEKAVLCDKRYVKVVAGAGAGKTKTVLTRVNYLVNYLDVDPRDILIMTFARETVKDIKNRIKENDIQGCRISTFHALGLSVLMQDEETDDHEGRLYTKLKEFLKGEITKRINNKSWDEETFDFADSLAEFLSIDDSIEADGENPVISERKETKEEKERRIRNILEEHFCGGKLSYEADKLLKLLKNFIELMKLNDLYEEKAEESFREWRDNAENPRIYYFIDICKFCFSAYMQFMGKDKLDFSDMIRRAKDILTERSGIDEDGNSIRKYRYIIVDEYQDISVQRVELIKALIKYSGEKFEQLMVVGDDWQSIYGFTGSKLDLFVDFESLIADRKLNKDELEYIPLKYTHRNTQEVIDIAGRFIKKNPKQMNKDLESSKKAVIKNPITWISYDEGGDIWACLETLRRIKKDRENDNLLQTEEKYRRDINAPVYVLNRYGERLFSLCVPVPHFDAVGNYTGDSPLFKKADDYIIPCDEELKDMKLKYMTVHNSKGLDADDVIVMGLEESEKGYGFPCRIRDDEIIELLNKKETINVEDGKEVSLVERLIGISGSNPVSYGDDYEEERRLFYVAMTRTKNRVYLLGSKQKKSRYITEVIDIGNEIAVEKKSENTKVNLIEPEILELTYYDNKKKQRKDWMAEGNYIIDKKGTPEDAALLILLSVKNICEANKYYSSVTEKTLKEFLSGNNTANASKKNHIEGFGCLKEIWKDADQDKIEQRAGILINKMVNKGLLYFDWFDKPKGRRDFVYYDREQIERWNKMTADDSDELNKSIIRSAENRVDEIINNPKAVAQTL